MVSKGLLPSAVGMIERVGGSAEGYTRLPGTISQDGIVRVEYTYTRVTTYRLGPDHQTLVSEFTGGGRGRQQGILWRTDHFQVK